MKSFPLSNNELRLYIHIYIPVQGGKGFKQSLLGIIKGVVVGQRAVLYLGYAEGFQIVGMHSIVEGLIGPLLV